MYAELKTMLFQYIPGTGNVNYIFFGMLVYIIGVYFIKTRWGAFVFTLILALVLKGADFILLGEMGSNTIEEFTYTIALPLILTIIQRRIGALG